MYKTFMYARVQIFRQNNRNTEIQISWPNGTYSYKLERSIYYLEILSV